jgi:hypothetical protein
MKVERPQQVCEPAKRAEALQETDKNRGQTYQVLMKQPDRSHPIREGYFTPQVTLSFFANNTVERPLCIFLNLANIRK